MTNIKCKPNLFIVGGAKCGTTSLCRNLGKHPQIYLPDVKEPQYMVSKFIKLPRNGPGDNLRDAVMISDINQYLDLYSEHEDCKYRIDGTVDMVYYPGVEKEIQEFNRDAKIIIMLRNPVDRAYSAYKMLKNMYTNVRETLSFEDALKAEKERMENNYEFTWAYKKCGLYYEQVKRYINAFGQDNVKVIVLDDISKDSEAVYKDIMFFLEVDYIKGLSKDIYNKSGKAKNQQAFTRFVKFVKGDSILKKIFKMIFRNHQTRMKLYEKAKGIYMKEEDSISDNTRNELIDYFRADIIRLSEYINKDLSSWMQ